MPFPKRSEAFQAGFDAADQGKTVKECPYKPKTKEFKEWVWGWIEASHVKHQDMTQG